MTAFDVIVVGVGGMGSAALWHLSRRGVNALGIERFDLAHDRGSSHGESRLIRRAYFEHPDYVPLVSRSYELWTRLEAVSGARLFHRTGLFLAGREDRPVIAGVRRAAQAYNLAIEDVPRDDAAGRFPGLVPLDDDAVLYEPDAGYLAVEECVRAHARQAVADGAELRFGETVLEWGVERDGAWVRTDKEHFLASSLIFCGGAWTGMLLRTLGLPLEIRRKVVLWYATKGDGYSERRGCPVFCFDTDEGFFYGFPSGDGATVKVGEHTGGQPLTRPEDVDRTLTAADKEPILRFLRRSLPFATDSLARHSVCLYTMTPDEHFIVDRHPDHERVFLACGFSGHGFKFASVIGKALADLAIDGRTDEPIGFLGRRRLRT